MKEKHNYTIRYDLDYFMTRLLGYLVANKYIIDPGTHQVIQNVTDAEDIFFEERRYGKTVTEALEIADEVLSVTWDCPNMMLLPISLWKITVIHLSWTLKKLWNTGQFVSSLKSLTFLMILITQSSV